MILSKNSINNYPFTANSTMLLTKDAHLGVGAIVSAFLYPPSKRTAYAYISFLGRRDLASGKGYITVSASSGDTLCEASFDLDAEIENGTITSQFFSKDIPCGTITVGQELLTVLKGRYLPAKDSFVFTPSVFRPIPNTNDLAWLRYHNLKVDEVVFSGSSYVVGGTVGRVVLDEQDLSGQQEPITTIIITTTNGDLIDGPKAILGPAGDEAQRSVNLSCEGGSTSTINVRKIEHYRNVSILPWVDWRSMDADVYGHTGSCIRVVASGSELKIGTEKDVR